MSQLVMDLQIRLGNRADLPRMQLLQESSLKVLGAKEYAPQQISALIKNQAESRHNYDEILILAEVAGQLVGFGCLNRDCNQIQGLFVHPDWARKGIGSSLIARMEGMARECRVRELIVTASLTGVPFYECQGYRTLHKTGFWASETVWIPCLEMAKYLPLEGTARTQSQSKSYDSQILTVAIATVVAVASFALAHRAWQQSQPQSAMPGMLLEDSKKQQGN